ncbi:hypothetical protein P7C73_g2853, partial [Tremellales sp. Uapishka_1]
MSYMTPPSTPSRPRSHSHSLLPISPPAPHRRAPRPPTYTPRRSRARHIRMQEPARCGLFTVSELDEVELSSRANQAQRLSWATISTASGGSGGLETPDEDEDESESARWQSEDDTHIGLCEALRKSFGWDVEDGSTTKPRRPPPLNLDFAHPYRTSTLSTDSESVVTPRSCSSGSSSSSSSACTSSPASSISLLPSLPIYDSPEWKSSFPSSPTTPTPVFKAPKAPSGRPVDLVSALEDLLTSCGEEKANLEELSLSFPFPPSTPPRRLASLPKSRPTSIKREPKEYRLMGDHSFLQSLSIGQDVQLAGPSPQSPSGRPASTPPSGIQASRGLPRRSPLPDFRAIGEAI